MGLLSVDSDPADGTKSFSIDRQCHWLLFADTVESNEDSNASARCALAGSRAWTLDERECAPC
jgi:hypothetical protein